MYSEVWGDQSVIDKLGVELITDTGISSVPEDDGVMKLEVVPFLMRDNELFAEDNCLERLLQLNLATSNSFFTISSSSYCRCNFSSCNTFSRSISSSMLASLT
jgi:hypothetical protein